MLVAVTGGSGHIGGVLIRDLVAAGHSVRAIDIARTDTIADLDIEFVNANVLDGDAIAGALSGVDVVCHLAAIISVTGDSTGIVAKVNGEGPGIVADAALAAGVQRMVHCSSVHAFDLSTAPDPLTETAARSIGDHLPAYDRSKWLGEQAVQKRVDAGLDAVIVNPTGIIGPLDFAPSRMGQVFLAIRDRRLPATVDGGFDWVDVRDVSSGIMAAMDAGATGENYLLSGQWLSIPDYALITAGICGVEPPAFTLPRWAAKAWSPLGTALAKRNDSALAMTDESLHALFNSPTVSSAKAQTDLNYHPRPLAQTLTDTCSWFATQIPDTRHLTTSPTTGPPGPIYR